MKRKRPSDQKPKEHTKSKKKVDSKALAAAAAARINAIFKAKGMINKTPSRPVLALQRSQEVVARIQKQVNSMSSGTSADIDINAINDAARLELTSGTVHREIEVKCGVSVGLHGQYQPPGAVNPTNESKLHLKVKGPQANVQKAKAMIDSIKIRLKPSVWQWGNGSSDLSSSTSLSSASLPSTSLVDTPILQLTAKGIAKTGHTGGPVMGVNEARGLAYGLHRQNFTKKKTIKLHIGIELKFADGFPLISKIVGVHNSHFVHIMKNSPGAILTLHGKGCVDGENEPLHIRIFGKDDQNLRTAKTLASDLVANIRREFRTWKMAKQKIRQQAQGLPFLSPSLFLFALSLAEMCYFINT
eukprot:831191-Amorphochlora_amoeboformis.AAC.2